MPTIEPKVRIELKQPVQTSENPLKIQRFGTPAPHVANNGFLKGGLTNPYLNQNALPSGFNFVDDLAGVINSKSLGSGLNRQISRNGGIIGQVSNYGIIAKAIFGGCADAMLTKNGTYLTLNYSITSTTSLNVTISEYSFAGVLLNTRTTSITSQNASDLAGLQQLLFIRYLNPQFSDDQELVNAWGEIVAVYREADPSTEYGVSVSPFVASPWMYRFENSEGYIFQNQGVNGWYINSSISSATALSTSYAFATVTNGYSSVIVTSNFKGIVTDSVDVAGYIGYDSGGTFTSSVSWYSMGWGSTPSSVVSYLVGYGYAEACMDFSGTYNWSGFPHPATFQTAFLNESWADTDIPASYYGLLTNTPIEDIQQPFFFRLNVVNGIQSTLSVAVGARLDAMGVLLSEIGAVDMTYAPQIVGYDTILWRYAGKFYIVEIGDVGVSTPPWTFQRISKNAYKINTISPNNILDISSQTLELGSIDYHGCYIPYDPVLTDEVAMVLYGKYCQSIDIGQRYFGSPFTGNSPPGGYIAAQFCNPGMLLSVFVNGVYAGSMFPNQLFTYGGTQSTVVLAELAGEDYAPSLLIPLPLGYTYGDRWATDTTKIILLDWFYTDQYGNQHEADLYVIGNEVDNFSVAFQLFGNIYVYDGEVIWLAQLTNNEYTGRIQIAYGIGLTFLDEGSDCAFFLSSFDNTIWGFVGSQELVKLFDFNQIDPILDGAYSVFENTLVLLTATRIVFVRDGQFSQIILLSASQTNLLIAVTLSGIIFSNGSYSWQYTFENLGGTVVALSWQSAYFGQEHFEKHVAKKFWLILYNAAKTATVVTRIISTYNETESTLESAEITIQPSDWDANGIARIRVQPQNQRALGTSIGIQCATKVTILDCFADFEDDAEGVVNPRLSA